MAGLALSVIVPTYNRAHTLRRALASALGELGPQDEVVVVDDGSTDDTPAVLASYGPPVRVVSCRRGGAAAARNRGIEASSRPLVAFLDSDDEWVPGWLGVRRAVMEARPDVVFSFTDFGVVLPDGREVHRYLGRWHLDRRPWTDILGPGVPLADFAPVPATAVGGAAYVGDLYPHEARANYVFTSTLLVRREAAGDALRFWSDLPTYEDWPCFACLARRGPAAYLDVETARQHSDGGGRVSRHDAVRAATARLEILARIWGADPGYLAAHETEHEHLVREERRRLVRALIGEGRSREARRALVGAGVPLSWRALARLPGPSLRALNGLRRWARRVSGAERRAARRWEAAAFGAQPGPQIRALGPREGW
jgi:hypothetical protein